MNPDGYPKSYNSNVFMALGQRSEIDRQKHKATGPNGEALEPEPKFYRDFFE